MKTLIYDTEIKHGVVTDNNPAQPGYHYAEGWTDFAGMGIATLCAYDVEAARYRVFCDDNLASVKDYISEGYQFIGFNNYRFDDLLLEAHGVDIPLTQSGDLAYLIWQAAGVLADEHPKGLGLDACCTANRLPGKTGVGADAPQDYQNGKIGKVIDYCLGDVRSTLALYRYISAHGGLVDPRNPQQWLTVVLPR
ncbi:MAG: hypothetical protein PHV02_18110 [Rhodocyclaceae bacterium]|nr:hypothetical protein [Rhodocyclaceae bacterium]